MLSRKLLPPGTILNRYRIESIIGEGGFGVTYLALEPVKQTYVAIKEYFPKRYANRQSGNTVAPNRSIDDQRVFKWGLKRFLDEARVLARLAHPNIVAVQKYFEMHGTAYLVMDYCEGEPLDKFVEDVAGVSPRRIFQIYIDLINALEHIHLHGIIHGDLKPSNILVLSNGTPVLLDFGSARQEMLRMAVGQVSDGYSPPEFYANSDKVGPWSDIYGLGATFYKLITGFKVPVATDRSVSDSYVSLSIHAANGYSVKFLELINSSLTLTVSERPQSIASLKRLLPEIGNFSNRSNVAMDLKGDIPQLVYSSPASSYRKPVSIVAAVLLISLGLILFLNKKSEVAQVNEVATVSPIQIIEEEPTPLDLPGDCNKNKGAITGCRNNISESILGRSSPVTDMKFQQALTYLSNVSNTQQITWYSIPSNELASQSFKYVWSEIRQQLANAYNQKRFVANEDEFVFKNINLDGVKAVTYVATDEECNVGTLGPPRIACNKIGKDLSCKFIDVFAKYKRACVNSFSM
jgi:serine/threonine protein kinase